MQTTAHILMVRPTRFERNQQTQSSNAFQNQTLTMHHAQETALAEFDQYVAKLEAAGVNVFVMNDVNDVHTPDSIFPNNWVSFHEDGTVFLYPMEAENRRAERNFAYLEQLQKTFQMNELHDLSFFENEGVYLEGTGSLVLDRVNRIAYVCRSSRSDAKAIQHWAKLSRYRVFEFSATDEQGTAIYHTNVMMSIGRQVAFVCMDSLCRPEERIALSNLLEDTGKVLIALSLAQMKAFAGNVLEVCNVAGDAILAMSDRAWNSFTKCQKNLMTQYVKPLHTNLDTIETLGGGGARCMIAEIHLPLFNK